MIEGISGDALYAALRHLTPPVAAVTCSADARRNALIVNSAQRASLVPEAPRISLYISKPNYSHDLVLASGVFGLHLLRSDQWELVESLGLRSGREADKLAGLELFEGATGCPLLADTAAAFDCRVVNAMDAGAATFFLADVVHARLMHTGPVMTSQGFRENAPKPILRRYAERLRTAQQVLAPLSGDVDATWVWNGPSTGP